MSIIPIPLYAQEQSKCSYEEKIVVQTGSG